MTINLLVVAIAYTDTTGNAMDLFGDEIIIPAKSLVTHVEVMRSVEWDVIGLFELGTSTDSDLLVKNTQHNLTGSGSGVSEIAPSQYFANDTQVVATWVQGGATQGTGSVIIQYVPNVIM